AADVVDPVGSVGRLAGGQYRRAILQRDAIDAGTAVGGQPQLIAQRGGAQIERRGADNVLGRGIWRAGLVGGDGGSGQIDQLVALVLNRRDFVLPGTGGVPPFVGLDPMAVGVGAGPDGCVAG